PGPSGLNGQLHAFRLAWRRHRGLPVQARQPDRALAMWGARLVDIAPTVATGRTPCTTRRYLGIVRRCNLASAPIAGQHRAVRRAAHGAIGDAVHLGIRCGLPDRSAATGRSPDMAIPGRPVSTLPPT